METCKICNKEFANLSSLAHHLRVHNIKKKEYYDKFLKKEGEGVCPVCSKPTTFLDMIRGYSKRCSIKCLHNDEKVKTQKKETCMLHYGTEFPLQNKEIYDKKRQTCIEVLGVEHPSQNEDIKEKKKQTNLKNSGVKHNWCKDKEGKRKCDETMLEKYNCSNASQISGNKEKVKQTSLKNWNTDSPNQSDIVKDKKKVTWLETLGVENPSQSKIVKEKKKASLFEHYGVSNTSELHPVTKKYKDTGLYYQSSYEKFFLEQVESVGLLGEIKRGPTFKYFWKKNEYFYYPDFILKDVIIEIKSGWTYNKNGRDEELQNLNETKLSAAREKGYKVVLLKGKEEIKMFINSFKA